MGFQSPPHRGRCCCRPPPRRVRRRPRLSVPSSSGKMLLSWCPPGRPWVVGPFSPLLIGEDAAVRPPRRRAQRRAAFQSPPHRGRCCCLQARFVLLGFEGLSVPSSSGKMLLCSPRMVGRMRLCSFSPLLIGEDAAVRGGDRKRDARLAFQSPPHRGRCCCSRYPQSHASALWPFSPLLIGEDAAVEQYAREDHEFPTFSPLLIGEDAAVTNVKAVARGLTLSVPSSSGKMLL